MKDIDIVPVPLYHGTDKKILEYSVAERTEIQELCSAISNYIYLLFSEDGLSISSLSNYKANRISEIGDYWYGFINAFQKCESRKKGSSLYQYDSLYLTGDSKKAKGYAYNAYIMGEQGYVAYWLYKAASRIWNLIECMPNMVEMFKDFDELINKPHIPVILTYHNIKKDDLLTERGEPINWEGLGDSINGKSFRLRYGSSTSIYDGSIEYLPA